MSVRDRHGDVEIVGKADGVDPTIVSSVDLRHVTVTRQRHGLRVVVRLKEVLPTRGRWAQQVGVVAIGDGWTTPSWVAGTVVTLQHVGSAFAYLEEVSDSEEDEADPDRDEPVTCGVAVTKGAKVVRLVVPERCLGDGPGSLYVGSILIDKRGDDPAIAVDELEIRKPVDFRSR